MWSDALKEEGPFGSLLWEVMDEGYLVDAYTGRTRPLPIASEPLDKQIDHVISHIVEAKKMLEPQEGSGLTAEHIAAVHFNKRALIDSHERMRRELASAETEHVSEIRMPCDLAGPASDAPRSCSLLSSLRKCSIRDLCSFLGRHATGLVLEGTLCVSPTKCVSIMTVLADEEGNAIRLSIYNLPCLQAEHWSQCFPKGMRLGIKEPYFKRSADGGFSVRVDDPRDLVYLTRVCEEPGVARVHRRP